MPNDLKLPVLCQTTLQDAMRPELFKAMCDPVRISIIATLATRREPSSVSDLAQCSDIDMSGVSRHLKILRDAGILSAQKKGRAVMYDLNTQHLVETLRGLAQALLACEANAG